MKTVITLIALLSLSSAFAVIENVKYTPGFEIVSAGPACPVQNGRVACNEKGTKVIVEASLGCGDSLDSFEYDVKINHDDRAVDIAISAVATTHPERDFYCISDTTVTKTFIVKSTELEAGFYDLRILNNSANTSLNTANNYNFDGYEHIDEEDDFEIKEIDNSYIF